MDLISTKITYFEHIPAIPEEKLILLRMGYHPKATVLSERDQSILKEAIRKGLALCRNRGAYARFKITERSSESVEIEGGFSFKSEDLARRLAHSDELVAMAATVGNEVVQTIAREVNQGKPSSGIIYDAVASESADAALDWIEGLLRKTLKREGRQLIKHRYSPGYGDLSLEYQAIIYNLLNLEKLDLKLTEQFLLVPEKSVLAITGIERIME